MLNIKMAAVLEPIRGSNSSLENVVVASNARVQAIEPIASPSLPLIHPGGKFGLFWTLSHPTVHRKIHAPK